MGPHSTRERAGGRLAIAPSMDPTLDAVSAPVARPEADGRVVWISGLGLGLGLIAAVIAKVLMALIALVTNLAFYGRVSTEAVGPANNHLGWLVVIVPVVGGVVVGLMARFGSAAIRGHGIPEAMEKVLFDESRIPVRLTFLKPLSAACAPTC